MFHVERLLQAAPDTGLSEEWKLIIGGVALFLGTGFAAYKSGRAQKVTEATTEATKKLHNAIEVPIKEVHDKLARVETDVGALRADVQVVSERVKNVEGDAAAAREAARGAEDDRREVLRQLAFLQGIQEGRDRGAAARKRR